MPVSLFKWVYQPVRVSIRAIAFPGQIGRLNRRQNLNASPAAENEILLTTILPEGYTLNAILYIYG